MLTYKGLVDGMETLISWTKRFEQNAEDTSLSPDMVDIILEEAGQVLLDNARIGELYNIIDRIRGYNILVDVDAQGIDLRVTLISAQCSKRPNKKADHIIILNNDGAIFQ